MSRAVRERPILFSAPMVKAILAGRKTQTRRVVKCPNPAPEIASLGALWEHGQLQCPYGVPGDRLWVRETWQQVTPTGNGQWHTVDTVCDGLPHRRLLYAADADRDEPPRWRPSIFMPRWASRITLEVTSVRVKRLQEISDDDAHAEGFTLMPPLPPGRKPHVRYFRCLWDEINGKTHPWKSNPWVWAIEFRRIAP